MKLIESDLINDLTRIEAVIKRAFAKTSDSLLEEWLSFSYMAKMIREKRGLCIKAIENNKIIGVIYAEQENPSNGKEGEEKWVVIVEAVDPDYFGQGIGSLLLKEMETKAKDRGVKKMFVFTNKGDSGVVSYYLRNGYKKAGWIQDYQYGENNSAVFLLKYL